MWIGAEQRWASILSRSSVERIECADLYPAQLGGQHLKWGVSLIRSHREIGT
jgi:hypothetical protein